LGNEIAASLGEVAGVRGAATRGLERVGGRQIASGETAESVGRNGPQDKTILTIGVATDSVGDDELQEAGVADRFMLQDVIGRAFGAFGVEDGTLAIDFEKEEFDGCIRTHVDAGVAFGFETTKDSNCHILQSAGESGIGYRNVVRYVMLSHFHAVGFESVGTIENEFEGRKRTRAAFQTSISDLGK